MPFFNSIASDVKPARSGSRGPVEFKPLYQLKPRELANECRRARVTATVQLEAHGLTHDEARCIATHALTQAVAAGEAVDPVTATLARAWDIVEGRAPFTIRHPGGLKSDVWCGLEARPKWEGKAFDERHG